MAEARGALEAAVERDGVEKPENADKSDCRGLPPPTEANLCNRLGWGARRGSEPVPPVVAALCADIGATGSLRWRGGSDVLPPEIAGVPPTAMAETPPPEMARVPPTEISIWAIGLRAATAAATAATAVATALLVEEGERGCGGECKAGAGSAVLAMVAPPTAAAAAVTPTGAASNGPSGRGGWGGEV